MDHQGLQTGYSSPLVYRGKVFTVSGQGLISCADAKTGKVLYNERMKGAFSASPIAGDGKVYCLDEKGVCTVFKAEATPSSSSPTNELGEGMLGTPAIANGLIFIRTDKALLCDWEVVISYQLSVVSNKLSVKQGAAGWPLPFFRRGCGQVLKRLDLR